MVSSGQRVGEYVLDERVGGGAFGEVWRARHHVWNEQLVAVKLPTDPSYLRELRREGGFAPQLNHTNIVRAIAFDPFADPPYLVMEYVDGSSLRPLINNRELDVSAALAVLRQVLAALEFAHGQGVIHRDVKPENVLIDKRAKTEGFDSPGAVKLTDFGLGNYSRGLSANSIAMSMSVKSPDANRIAGTLEYMSPEQRFGGDVDARSDLFAAGVMLFEMLTGSKPVGGEMPSELNPAVERWLDDVYRRACARLEKRFTSAAEFATALRPGARPPPLPVGRAVPNPPAPSSSPGSNRCPTCRTAVGAHDQFCIGCGRQLVRHVRRCRSCGGYPAHDDRFCTLCGEELGSPVVTA